MVNVDCSEAGPGRLTAHVQGPHGEDVEADVFENSDTSYDVFYTAMEEGKYIKMNPCSNTLIKLYNYFLQANIILLSDMVVNIFAILHSTFVLSDLKPIVVESVEVSSHQTHLDHTSWLFQLVSPLELFPV